MSALDAHVLVLNRNYQPVAVTRAVRAFGLLYSGSARALDSQFQSFDFESWAELAAEKGDDVIHTPSLVLKIPRVVVPAVLREVSAHQGPILSSECLPAR